MVKRAGLVAVGVVLAAVLAACAPIFGSGATVSVAPLGALATVNWTAASADAGQSVASYQIEVDGTQVGSVPGTLTGCVLTGLAPNRTYQVSVTAYDDTGAWSGGYTGDLAASGRLTTSYTTGSASGGGWVRGCVNPTDSDHDRLPDALENGSGAFVSVANPGTNRALADTDGDGISDGDETLGTAAGLDLPAFGVRAVHKDLLFEADWFDDNADPGVCGTHSHRPTATVVSRVTAAFAAAPVTNPDGTTGIRAVVDYGQGGATSGGNKVADADGLVEGDVFGTQFTSTKAANFSAKRVGYFHYMLMPHRYNTSSNSSGYAEFDGDDLIVSLQCYGSTSNVANTIMHEVGHNFGLHHGGDEDLPNYKPNYNSVMNYRYQFPGVDVDCNAVGDGVLDYSVGQRAQLNEYALLETDGICNGVDIDWNGNGSIDAAPVAVDLTQDGSGTILRDVNDWGLIDLAAVSNALRGAPLAPPVGVVEQPVPPSAR